MLTVLMVDTDLNLNTNFLKNLTQFHDLKNLVLKSFTLMALNARVYYCICNVCKKILHSNIFYKN